MSRRLRNRMDPVRWLPSNTHALLDVGCNDGALLGDVQRAFPGIMLAGCDVDPAAVNKARQKVPGADIRCCAAEALPFDDGTFPCVTCIEVLEHIPPPLWTAALTEMARVCVPGGRLILRTPHAGLFAWLDSNNLRFRFPGLYRRLVGRGRRDDGYAAGSAGVVWHHHFSRQELRALAAPRWRVEAVAYGGLVLFPIADILAWPFYRTRRIDNPILHALLRIMDFEYSFDFGTASYGILMAFRRSA